MIKMMVVKAIPIAASVKATSGACNRKKNKDKITLTIPVPITAKRRSLWVIEYIAAAISNSAITISRIINIMS
jgi:hypothetical protein